MDPADRADLVALVDREAPVDRAGQVAPVDLVAPARVRSRLPSPRQPQTAKSQTIIPAGPDATRGGDAS
ncbi:hypothetical protein [Mycobacterium malmoense]|uniref:hypothetical protein n=1 Tax=Mycobacterium malmoense TaxID=1780 RepID=UPI00159430DA|nr:hypothetical protein [Mycobacterium malmoense]